MNTWTDLPPHAAFGLCSQKYMPPLKYRAASSESPAPAFTYTPTLWFAVWILTCGAIKTTTLNRSVRRYSKITLGCFFVKSSTVNALSYSCLKECVLCAFCCQSRRTATSTPTPLSCPVKPKGSPVAWEEIPVPMCSATKLGLHIYVWLRDLFAGTIYQNWQIASQLV